MRHPDVLRHKPFFGTEEVEGDSRRNGRCYELSCYALLFGSAPRDAILVHGSIHGPKADNERIAHSWLELPNGKVWEPFTRLVYRNWAEYADAREERRYTRAEAARKVKETESWGCWHDTEWPTRDADSGDIIRRNKIGG
jgi:hypothetical protein